MPGHLHGRRRFAPIVRLEANDDISDELLAWLVGELDIDGELDVYLTDAPLGLPNLTEIARLDVPRLHFSPFSPVSPPRLRAASGR